MAKNISLMGASYSDVPAVTLPQTGGGTARFDDASVTTATAEDVASGKVFLSSNGTVTVGTGSGGGAVTSVNGQTGDVVLDAADVGALPDTTVIPTKTSDLTNDSGFITGMTILSYGSSTWNDFLTAYQSNKVVYCRASSNSNPASGSQTRLAFMAYVNNATNPTSVEFQYYRSVNIHSATQQGDQVYVYALNNSGTWSVIARESYTKIAAGTNMSQAYSNGTLTLSFDGTIPTKTSDLTNDSGFVDASAAASVAPVQSVNGQTGTVVLDAADVGALPDTTVIPTKIDNLTIDAITEPSTQFPVPAVGDNGSTLFGKISKWFSDMAALVATKLNAANVVNNLTTTASGYALDARQGKVLGDIITPTVAPLTSVAIGSTYQIPANVLAHSIIIISMTRYGYGGSMVISSELIRAGFLSNGFKVNRGTASAEYWMAKISQDGLLTMLSSSTSSDAPNVQIVGII